VKIREVIEGLGKILPNPFLGGSYYSDILTLLPENGCYKFRTAGVILNEFQSFIAQNATSACDVGGPFNP